MFKYFTMINFWGPGATSKVNRSYPLGTISISALKKGMTIAEWHFTKKRKEIKLIMAPQRYCQGTTTAGWIHPLRRVTQLFMSIHPLILEKFQSGPNFWTDRQTLLFWVKYCEHKKTGLLSLWTLHQTGIESDIWLREVKVSHYAVLSLPGVYVLTNNSSTGEEQFLAGLWYQIQSDLYTAVAYATLKMKAERESHHFQDRK